MKLRTKTKQALSKAIIEEDSIQDLEFVGVPVRILSTLADNGVLYISNLLQMSSNDILSIQGIRPTTLTLILNGLANYDKIPELKAEASKKLLTRINTIRSPNYDSELDNQL